MPRPLLTVIVSHPIQYHAPLFRRLAQSEVLDLQVEFLSQHGLSEDFDHGFGQAIRFDVPLVEGYENRSHKNFARSSVPSSFLGCVNPQLALKSAVRGDVVLMHGYTQSSMWFTALGCAARKTPYMIRGESRLDTEFGMSRAKLNVKRQTVGRLVRGASVCLPIGQPNRAFYRAYGVPDSRLVSAPYSVDNGYFAAPRADVRSTREQRLVDLGLNPDRPTLLFAGKLVARKRPGDILEVTRRMDGACNLMVVGSGALEGELRERYADTPGITFLGLLNQSGLRDAYCLADISVLPSEFEPWGLTVNESMAAGCLPIVSDAVGSGADLVATTTGAIFPVGDVDALQQRVSDCVGQQSDAAVHSAVAQAVGRFSIEATARGIERGALLALDS